MMKINKAFVIGAIYIAAAFLTFAVFRYFYVVFWAEDFSAKDRLVMVRVFLTAPGLLVIGILLLILTHEVIHRLFGIVFILLGVAWAIEIIQTFIEEAA